MTQGPTQYRDRLGRPLRGPTAVEHAFPQIDERDFITAEQTWALAREYLEQDLPFHVHEVFEQRWRCCPSEERQLWQALAQFGAALTHAARANAPGAYRVGSRSLFNLMDALQ